MNQAQQIHSTSHPKRRLWCIRIFLLCMMAAISIDTLPSYLATYVPIRKPINTLLNTIGIGQGDWPLFAPNPVINNGTLIAEIQDQENHRFQWSSPDWSKQTVWYKFHQFRQMNFYHRLPRHPLACRDMANYLCGAIPTQQPITPMADFTQASENVAPPLFVPPIRELNLYNAQFKLVPPDDATLPQAEDIFWSYQMRPLIHITCETMPK